MRLFKCRWKNKDNNSSDQRITNCCVTLKLRIWARIIIIAVLQQLIFCPSVSTFPLLLEVLLKTSVLQQCFANFVSRWPGKVQHLITSCCLSCSTDKQWLQAKTQNSFERRAIFLLSLVNDQSRSHGYLIFSNDCLRKANDFQFLNLWERLSFSFSRRLHGYFTASRLRTTSR